MKFSPDALYSYLSFGHVVPPLCIWYNSTVPRLIEHGMDLTQPKVTNRIHAKARLKLHITLALEELLRGMDPPTIFMSGGVDSGLVTALTRRVMPRNKKEIYTFTAGMHGGSSSEFKYARASALRSLTKHFEVPIERDVLDRLPQIAGLLRQPNADPAALAFYRMANKAREYGIKSVLLGQNADTIFGARNYFKYIYRLANAYRFVPSGVGWVVKGLSCLFPEGNTWRRMRYVLPQAHYLDKLLYFKSYPLWRLKPATALRKNGAIKWLSDSVSPLLEKAALEKPHADMVDMLIYLETYYLEQQRTLEAMIGASGGLSLHSPYFEETLMNFAIRLPNSVRAEGGWNKVILREIAEPYVPPVVCHAAVKSLVAPFNEWFAGEFGRRVVEYLMRDDFLNRVLNMQRVKEWLGKRHSEWGDVVYQLLMLAVWHKIHYEDDQARYLTLGELIR